MTHTKHMIGRALIFLGAGAGLISFWFTLQFTWTPEFQAPALDIGPTHSNYHAFREAMLALAVNLLLIWAGIKGAAIRLATWVPIAFMVFFYYLGWWLAWPIWGYHAPYIEAEMVHVAATVGGLAGLGIFFPGRNQPAA